MVETMRWEQGSLVLLDQTLLPQKIEWITCVDYKRVKVAIERLEVRGAPAIGAAAAFAMVLGAREVADKPDFLGALDVVRADLITARPTAVNLAWAANLQYALAVRLNGEDKSPAAIIKEPDHPHQQNEQVRQGSERLRVYAGKAGGYPAEVQEGHDRFRRLRPL